jgi:signal transduction histidine kinase
VEGRGFRWPRAPSWGWFRPLRLISLVTLVVLGAVAIAVSVVAQRVIHDQEQLILRERTGEAAAVLTSALSGIQQSLLLLGMIAASDHGRPGSFTSAARLVSSGSSQVWLVTSQETAGMRVTAAAGRGPAAGQLIAAGQERLARRALSARGMVSGVLRESGSRWLAFAEGRGAGPGTVVWELSRLTPQAQAAASPASPWGNLAIALYSAPRPDASALIVATAKDLPLAGLRYPFRVGTETWLLVTASPRPLVGSLAENMPWILLAGGVFAAVLATAIVEFLVRRRQDTEALVADRTASLRTTMTELEAAQAQLLRQERLAAVGQLASTVGHELRNPLAVVSNVLYLLEAGAGPDAPEGTRRHLATAKREVAAATVIVSDLLDYSAGRAPITAPVAIPDLVSEVLSVVPPPAGVRVDREDEVDAVIDADHDQIRQVLLNLITNAYDAMPDGGVLTVSSAPASGSVQITVTDTGEGMTAQAQEKIFTPFYTSKTRGIGLGLAVTRRIVEAHGGEITVHSVPSAGSSFTITVPAALASVPP